MIEIEITGLEPIRQRFSQFPHKFNTELDAVLDASLIAIHEDIPSYPAYSSPYRRTGTLGRTLGVGQSGGKSGKPDIYDKKIGPRMFEASFGTRLHYAPFVVGETTQARHMGHWWTVDGTVYRKVKPRIEKLFRKLAEDLARWLDGRGL